MNSVLSTILLVVAATQLVAGHPSPIAKASKEEAYARYQEFLDATEVNENILKSSHESFQSQLNSTIARRYNDILEVIEKKITDTTTNINSAERESMTVSNLDVSECAEDARQKLQTVQTYLVDILGTASNITYKKLYTNVEHFFQNGMESIYSGRAFVRNSLDFCDATDGGEFCYAEVIENCIKTKNNVGSNHDIYFALMYNVYYSIVFPYEGQIYNELASSTSFLLDTVTDCAALIGIQSIISQWSA